jgi:hypothetical protein
MRIELVFFSPSQLILSTVERLFRKERDVMCVRISIAFGFVHMDISTFISWYDVNAMLSVINGPPFLYQGYGALLSKNFPTLTRKSETICEVLRLKTWASYPYLPDGFTISVPTGNERCPVILLYGKDSSKEDWSVFEGMSSALRLMSSNCRLAIACEGSLFGSISLKESVSQIVQTLEARI